MGWGERSEPAPSDGAALAKVVDEYLTEMENTVAPDAGYRLSLRQQMAELVGRKYDPVDRERHRRRR